MKNTYVKSPLAKVGFLSHSHKQAILQNARNLYKFVVEFLRITNNSEICIDDEVPIVRDDWSRLLDSLEYSRNENVFDG